jgi:hypothetical protein
MGVRIATFDNRQVARSVEDLAIITPEEYNLAQQLIENRKKPMNAKEKFNYLLSDLIFCELCEQNRLIEQEKTKKRMAGKPLINHERTKQGKIIATYECKEHNIKLEQKEIENLVCIKARDFFTKLLDTHFDKLYSFHLKSNLAELSKLKTSFQKELELAEEKLVLATNNWVNKDSEATRERVLECSNNVKKIKEKLFDLEVKKQKFIEVPDFMDEIKEEVLKEEKWNLLAFTRRKDLINDLIQAILVDEISLRIVFKHPYLESNEVVI